MFDVICLADIPPFSLLLMCFCPSRSALVTRSLTSRHPTNTAHWGNPNSHEKTISLLVFKTYSSSVDFWTSFLLHSICVGNKRASLRLASYKFKREQFNNILMMTSQIFLILACQLIDIHRSISGRLPKLKASTFFFFFGFNTWIHLEPPLLDYLILNCWLSVSLWK